MEINFTSASFKDFEDIAGMDMMERARYFGSFLDCLEEAGHLNYRLVVLENYGPEVLIRLADGRELRAVSLVSNDYWGLGQHPAVKAAAIRGIELFGAGTGASPAIGGHFHYHELIEQAIARFFGREAALLYTTGYTANSATIQCLMRKADYCHIDQKVHASVYEGGQLTNVKTFPHNNLEALDQNLFNTKDYRTKLVVIDGVYSQDGDLSLMREISALCKKYGAYLAVDDAHGIGVMGATGRGVIEHFGMLGEVDLITGTFSKTFGHLGGYVVGNADLIRYLKFQSRQHLFSVTSTPASACILKSIELMDEEPFWKDRLWDNIRYLKSGLDAMGLDTGVTESAIIPVRIGERDKTLEVGRLLLDAGVYANPIMYPAVSKKDCRIRMSVMATHTREHLDRVLDAYAGIIDRMDIRKN